MTTDNEAEAVEAEVVDAAPIAEPEPLAAPDPAPAFAPAAPSEPRPELLIGGAFLGGMILAKLLGRRHAR